MGTSTSKGTSCGTLYRILREDPIKVGAAITDGQGQSYRIGAEPPKRGGQADVYRATARDGRTVAVKHYREQPELALLERRLLDEVRAVDRQVEEWLVTVLGHGEADGRPFLMLPWMPETLTSWAPRHGVRDRLRALELAAAAVVRLHRSTTDLTGYRVHRDIKPTNLLLSEETGALVVLLADLGAAKQGGVLDLTENTGVLTRYFAPPEQMLPLDRPPSESWDVHGLAVTVFHGLTGKMPTPAIQAQNLLNDDGLALIELAQRAAHGSPLSPTDRRRYEALRRAAPETLLDLTGASGWRPDDQNLLENTLFDEAFDADPVAVQRAVTRLGEALARALDPDPRRRESSARPLLAALREARGLLGEGDPASRGVKSTPDTPAPTPRRGRNGWVWGALAAALGALVLCGGAGVWGWRYWREVPAPVVVPAPVLAPKPVAAPAPTSVATPETAPPTPTATKHSDPSPAATPSATAASRPTAREPAPAVPARSYEVTFLACPLGDVMLHIDGVAHVVSPLGKKLSLSEGPHELVWRNTADTSADSRAETVSVSPGQTRFCANLAEGPCLHTDCR